MGTSVSILTDFTVMSPCGVTHSVVTTNAVLLLNCQLPAGITAKATIADMEPETFELMLGWMYGTIDVVLPLDQAVDVYVASDRLGMTALHDACAHNHCTDFARHLQLPTH